MNKKIFQTSMVIFIWALIAFAMSILYYWLKSIGFIWDNPEPIRETLPWNGRKVIFAVTGLASFILAIVKVVIIWDETR